LQYDCTIVPCFYRRLAMRLYEAILQLCESDRDVLKKVYALHSELIITRLIMFIIGIIGFTLLLFGFFPSERYSFGCMITGTVILSILWIIYLLQCIAFWIRSKFLLKRHPDLYGAIYRLRQIRPGSLPLF